VPRVADHTADHRGRHSSRRSNMPRIVRPTSRGYIAGLRRRLGIKPDVAAVQAQTRERVRKHRQRRKSAADA
jgi:hypothetical protein